MYVSNVRRMYYLVLRGSIEGAGEVVRGVTPAENKHMHKSPIVPAEHERLT